MRLIGFHIRFRDVSRGGIRLIKSPSMIVYDRNAASLFEENYNLAFTQQLKNKDIPEGGMRKVEKIKSHQEDDLFSILNNKKNKF